MQHGGHTTNRVEIDGQDDEEERKGDGNRSAAAVRKTIKHFVDGDRSKFGYCCATFPDPKLILFCVRLELLLAVYVMLCVYAVHLRTCHHC